MANTKISALTAVVTPDDTDRWPVVQNMSTTPVTKYQTGTVTKAWLKTYFDTLYQALSGKDATGGYVGLTLFKINFKNAANSFTSFFTNTNTAARTYTAQDRDGTLADNIDVAMPDGTVLNGKFVVSITSNNITVTLTDKTGANPSATNPIYVWINGTKRSVTAALSITVNAGTNSFNAGATEFATMNTDFFVYLAWKSAATAIVSIGFSRVPYACVYSDFSATATNEKYGVFSTTPAATDDVVNIGRFRAQNSGTASFNWSSISASAPDTENTKQKPTYETSWSNWVPTYQGFSSPPASSLNRYKLVQTLLNVEVAQPNAGTSNATNFTMTSPFTAGSITSGNWNVMSAVVNGGTVQTTPGFISILSNSGTINVFLDAAGNNWGTTLGKRVTAYRLAYPLIPY